MKGEHYCQPRATKAREFFAQILVHTKGDWARTAFVLAAWQFDEIIGPVFGWVKWDPDRRRYVRKYRILWIELARKNGKSELLAGIALYLLVSDDEEGAEIYGCAKDRDQARKVFDVACRMVELSPELNKRLRIFKQARRIVHEASGSYYEVIAADASGNLGHNPHGIVFDEILAQPSGDLWDALRTAMGARAQPLMVAATTAGNDPESFAAVMHEEMVRIAEDPKRAPHILAVARNTPRDADPWDEANWAHANPGLGDFLSIQALRDEALEARNDPTKENAFRQFRLNQWVSQVTRWMPLHLWDASNGGHAGALLDEAALHGRTCYAGLDLASTTDLAALVLLFPPDQPDGIFDVLWRFWTPEAQLAYLDSFIGGKATVWARQGLLYATEGDWIDYAGDAERNTSHSTIVGKTSPSIHKQIRDDHEAFRIVKAGYDQREATATAQYMQELGIDIEPVWQGYGLSQALKEIMRLVKATRLNTGGNPVARWNIDSAEVRQDDEERIKLVKPKRDKSGKRIDGIAGLGNAVTVYLKHADEDVSNASDYLAALTAGRAS